MNSLQRVSKAKANLIINSPFFGSLAIQMRVHIENSARNPTMATDGEHLYVNEEFLSKLVDVEVIGVLAHEVMHCALNHHTRKGNRNHQLWNIACDYAINNDLIKHGFTLPKGGLIDPIYNGMSAEEIYDKILKDNPSIKVNFWQNGQFGDVWEPGDGSEKAIEKAKTEQAIKNQQAATFAANSSPGKELPDAIAKILKDAKPIVDWRPILARYITEAINRDYSWRSPNKMFLPYDIIMPSLIPDGINRIVFAIDVSGSIYSNMKLFGQFVAEAIDAASVVAIDKITVIQCDSSIRSDEEFNDPEELKTITIQGGGGTAFSPVMNLVREKYSDAALVIYFTDLECTDYGQEPDCPVLWAAYGSRSNIERWSASTPYGEVMHVMESVV